MESYIVHIYRPDSRNSSDIIGVVEDIESEKHYPFTGPDELWDMLAGKKFKRVSGKKILILKKEGFTMIKKRLAVFMITVFIMSLPVIVNAQFANEIKLPASDGVAGDSFGITVAASGNTVIIGARDDDNGVDSGSAYVYSAPDITVTDSVAPNNDLQIPLQFPSAF